jgi:hypothetical protein
MVLRASAAANAFGRKRRLGRFSKKAVGEQARVRRWTPVLLLWARKDGRAQAVTPAHGPIAASWVSNFHLHFHAAATMSASGRVRDVAEHNRARGGVHASRVHWRVAGAARAKVARGSPASPEPFAFADRANVSGLFGSIRAVTARHVERSRIRPDVSHWSFADRGPSRYAREPVRRVREATSEAVARAARRSLFNTAIQSGGVIRERNREVHFSLTRTRSQLLSLATGAPLHLISHIPAREDAHSISGRHLQDWAVGRSVELVWRAGADGAVASSATPPVMTSYTAPSINAASTSSSPTVVAGRPRDAAVVCATALDPLLANRLADEVIRRIDRRARIERERCGI